ncbi:MAG TPA: hypothetical protein VGQ87_02420, partial [Patescibacteria group bacterium]|nr:hypothetical protein [Patescibacteria group bacterium]
EPGAKISSIDFKRITHPTFDTRKLFVLYGVMGIISLLAWIAAGLLLAGFLRGRVHTIINHAYNKPWQNMGTGLIAVIVAPVLIVLLFITVVGYYVALILAAVYGLMVLLSMLLSAIFLGAWIMKYADKNFIFNQKWWQAVIVGAVALKILSWIPFLGWLAACLLFLTLLGALLRIFKEDIVRMR